MFNLQLFGDNDTLTASTDLKVNMGFVDADTRLATIPNPKTNLTGEQIGTVFAMIAPSDSDVSLLVSDKNGADYSGITEAYNLEKTDRKLDLS